MEPYRQQQPPPKYPVYQFMGTDSEMNASGFPGPSGISTQLAEASNNHTAMDDQTEDPSLTQASAENSMFNYLYQQIENDPSSIDETDTGAGLQDHSETPPGGKRINVSPESNMRAQLHQTPHNQEVVYMAGTLNQALKNFQRGPPPAYRDRNQLQLQQGSPQFAGQPVELQTEMQMDTQQLENVPYGYPNDGLDNPNMVRMGSEVTQPQVLQRRVDDSKRNHGGIDKRRAEELLCNQAKLQILNDYTYQYSSSAPNIRSSLGNDITVLNQMRKSLNQSQSSQMSLDNCWGSQQLYSPHTQTAQLQSQQTACVPPHPQQLSFPQQEMPQSQRTNDQLNSSKFYNTTQLFDAHAAPNVSIQRASAAPDCQFDFGCNDMVLNQTPSPLNQSQHSQMTPRNRWSSQQPDSPHTQGDSFQTYSPHWPSQQAARMSSPQPGTPGTFTQLASSRFYTTYKELPAETSAPYEFAQNPSSASDCQLYPGFSDTALNQMPILLHQDQPSQMSVHTQRTEPQRYPPHSQGQQASNMSPHPQPLTLSQHGMPSSQCPIDQFNSSGFSTPCVSFQGYVQNQPQIVGQQPYSPHSQSYPHLPPRFLTNEGAQSQQTGYASVPRQMMPQPLPQQQMSYSQHFLPAVQQPRYSQLPPQGSSTTQQRGPRLTRMLLQPKTGDQEQLLLQSPLLTVKLLQPETKAQQQLLQQNPRLTAKLLLQNTGDQPGYQQQQHQQNIPLRRMVEANPVRQLPDQPYQQFPHVPLNNPTMYNMPGFFYQTFQAPNVNAPQTASPPSPRHIATTNTNQLWQAHESSNQMQEHNVQQYVSPTEQPQQSEDDYDYDGLD